MITIAHINVDGLIVNVSVWAADPQQDGLVPVPDGLPVGIGHYYRNDRFEFEDGTEIVIPEPMPEPEPPEDATADMEAALRLLGVEPTEEGS